MGRVGKKALAPKEIKGENYSLKLVEESIKPSRLARWVDYVGKYKGAKVELSVRLTKGEITYYATLKGNTYPIKEELKKAGFYYSAGEWNYKGENPPSIFKEVDLSELKTPEELTKEELKEIFKGKEINFLNLDEYVNSIYERIQKKLKKGSSPER